MTCAAVTEAVYAPRDRFLALLADGWRFPDDVAEEMAAHHGHWSVLLVREEMHSQRSQDGEPR